MIHCEYCGAKNKDEFLECHKCGAPLPIAEKESDVMDYPFVVGERGPELFIPRVYAGTATATMWENVSASMWGASEAFTYTAKSFAELGLALAAHA